MNFRYLALIHVVQSSLKSVHTRSSHFVAFAEAQLQLGTAYPFAHSFSLLLFCCILFRFSGTG